jgi:short-subunit dehydrogenase
MRPEPRRLALVTGASAGIGAAFARAYAARGWDLALTARRADRLDALAGDLAARHGVTVYALPDDLSDPEAPGRLTTAVAERDRCIDALVNNAGYGLRGPTCRQSPADQRALMQVLTTAVMSLSHAVLPGMRARGYGRIVNVASVLGLIPGAPGSALYSGAKAFVVGFSEGMHLEYRAAGVHVTALCPGLTRSEFHQVSGMTADIAGAPGWMWMDAEAVAEAGLAAVEANHAVCTPGLPNKAVVLAAALLPRGWVMNLIAGRMKSATRAF